MATKSLLPHKRANELLRVELERTLILLRSLSPAEWQAPTDCPGWDVHTMYLHVLGACEASASMRENAHQLRTARRYQREHGGPLEAALSATQIAERLALSPDALVERLSAVAPSTIRKRRRMPGLVRRLPLKVDGPIVEKWTLGYLSDVIYLRDLWMHRVDASHATGRAFTPDAHDAAIIADVVEEWFGRHGKSATLRLSGEAGREFNRGGDTIDVEPIEFCRTLAGRVEPAHPLLATIVPF